MLRYTPGIRLDPAIGNSTPRSGTNNPEPRLKTGSTKFMKDKVKIIFKWKHPRTKGQIRREVPFEIAEEIYYLLFKRND